MNDNKKYELLGIGTAILDVISYKPSTFLTENNLTASSMTLVDYETSQKLYEKLGVATECSGGSTANTVASFSILGGRAAFIGKTKDDFGGRVFKKEIEKIGADFISTNSKEGVSTSRCVILVTEETGRMGKKQIERTMATYLDPKVVVSEEDISEEVICSADIIVTEGYMFDNPKARAAILKSMDIAKKNGVKIAFSLSDPFCVQRHLADFLDVVENRADIIFANESEACALYGSEDIKSIMHKFLETKSIKCITRSELGSYVIWDQKLYDIEAVKVADVYDVTGAGDSYAAGFLFGYARGHSPEICGKIASASAAEVIKYIGARPMTDLAQMYSKIASA